MAGIILTGLLLYVFYLRNMWLSQEQLTRAQAAKMLALMHCSKTECEAAVDVSAIRDVDENSWYGKYVSVVINEGWMSLTDDGDFRPMDAFTYGDMRTIMECFHVSEDNLSFSMDFVQEDGLVPKHRWLEVFRLLCVQNSQITTQVMLIIGTGANMTGLNDWQLLSGDGLKGYEGLTVDMYLYKEVTAWVRDDEILCIIGESGEEAMLENVWISQVGDTLDIFTQGFTLNMAIGQPLEEDVAEQMGDIVFENGTLKGIRIKPDHIRARLTAVAGDSMTLEGYGQIPTTEKLVIYQIYPQPMNIQPDQLLADGSTTYEFVLEGGSICGVIWQAYTEESIRVLLHDDSDTDDIHEYVTLTCDETYWVASDSMIEKKQAGEEWTISAGDPRLEDGKLTIKADSEEGKIRMLSLDRGCGIPSYRGTIELQPAQGGILVINELLLEEYLYGVVPSEMPSDYGEEALKVQAVCARTFARAHLDSSFNGYDAHVDDTVSSQVYNNTLETDASIQAVKETAGQVLETNGDLISVYFFSTSCGHTSDAADVWYTGEGDTTVSEACGRFLSDENIPLVLSEREDFVAFIDNDAGYGYFEQDIPWFRWQTTVSLSDIQEHMTEEQRTSVGRLTEVSEGERAESGLLKTLVLKGENGSLEIFGEYRIRSVLSPENTSVLLQDGEEVTGATLLPSGYIYMEPVLDAMENVTGYEIHGGGYGHGTGMSQNGAWTMAKAGKNYQEILEYFFPAAELIVE